MHGDVNPDVTLLLDAPVEVGLERASQRGEVDRFETEQVDFVRRVRDHYLALARTFQANFHWCIEQFGVERCMFESNFPVDKVSYAYPVMWNAFKRVAQGFSPSEKAALFHDTAARIYRLATN